jgi:acyl carrier protein
VEQLIADFLRKAHPIVPFNPLDSTDLFKDGWLDSLLQLQLLNFLEKEFQVTVPAFQVSLNNFCTITAIAALMKRLQNAGAIA